MAMVGLVAMMALIAAPAQTALASEILLSVVFLAWIGLRLAGAAMALQRADPPLRLRDGETPGLHGDCRALSRSPLRSWSHRRDRAAGLSRYYGANATCGVCAIIPDYPPEKLDVKLVVEGDDAETRAAIERCASRIPIEVLVVPAAGPRTKPKALNVALPFVRGAFTVIYDAEDRPEAGQLRRALQAFVGAGEELACVQACLAIDNTSDSWLARLFTGEYAGQFDVFLPGIAALRLPLPLGGSSNHFRTATLRELGGWDAYNVTEGADLGMRLARFGYRTAIIDSTTYEEAPAQFLPWLRQRTRWFKGWMRPVNFFVCSVISVC